MRIKLTLDRQGGVPADVVVTVEPTAPLSAVAEALASRDPAGRGTPSGPVALRLHGSDGSTSVPPPDVTVAQVSLRSGSRVSLAPVAELHSGGSRGAAVATLRVHSGPDAGREFPLPQGSSLVGRSRSSHVRLSDGLVSKEHARINVAETVEVVDLNSANGVLVDGAPVERVVLGRDDSVLLGDTRVSVVLHRAALGAATGSPTLEFNRPPRLARRYEGETFTPPEAPTPPNPGRLPWISLLAPLLMGAVLYAVTRSVYSLLFVAMSPVLGLGTYLEGRIGGRRSHRAARAQYREALGALREDVDRAHGEEVVGRQAEMPPVEEVLADVVRQSTRLWSRRPDVDDFLQLRLGSGTQASRTEVEAPRQRGVDADLVAELAEVRERAARVDGVPVVADLIDAGSIGVGGPGEAALAVARGLLVQLVGLHSPADLVLTGVASTASAARWSWTAWLPHVGSAYSPLPGGHLESTGAGCAELVGALADLVDARAPDRDAGSGPRVVLLVENDAPVLRARLVDLAERGPAVGVHLLWVAPSVDQLPAACRAYVDVGADGSARAGLVRTGETVAPLEVETVTLEQAQVVARALAPVVDIGALVDDDSDLPASVTTLALAGTELGSSTQAVVDRWTETDSLHPRDGEQLPPRRTDVTLRALVGQAASSAMYLDLLTQGPHALVGGTTGAGKSEFLQTWVLSMAASYSPERVTFLFVDYKGGSAFKDCVGLPHSVGMVTDLSPHLVRRALASLNAELTHRERVLHRHGAKDLAALEKKRATDCPPRLVIVVDEFAALVTEVPEFVDGVVNVAQRGRSLGLHLILATQRPTGVIKENLRANTNLRVALRMNDEADSTDVLGSPLAAGFDPEVPGRAAARTGPGRMVTFQSSYSGAHTPDEAPPPDVQVEDLVFGPTRRWEQAEVEAVEGATDIERLASSVGAAARQLELAPPRRPWLPVLAAHYDVAGLPRARKDEELVIGVADEPAAQKQTPVAFRPDIDGNLVVFGTGGTGKSATLRTIAVVAGLTLRGGPCRVYGIDAAGGALSMLEDLPHVGSVIRGDDTDRILRLLRDLDALVDERSVRYAAVRAGTLPEYRELGGRPDEPRILLLVDGFAAFRADFEASRLPVFSLFQSVVAAGRQVGVHVVVSADRPVTVPSSIGSAFQQRLTLRLADENDYSLLGLPADVLSATSPAGRGILAGREVQVAVLGKQGTVAEQAAAIRRMGEALRRAGEPQAPAVGTLPTLVDLTELPVSVEGLPTLGIEDRGLQPVGFRAAGCLVVCGAPRTGRTTVAQTVVASATRADGPPPVLLHLGSERSPLRQLFAWDAASEPGAGVEEAITKALALAAGRRLVAVLEDVFDPTRPPSQAMLDLAERAAATGHLVVGVGEPADLARNLPLTRLLRADRQGVALCPDQGELSSVFQVTDIRIADRNVFPPGRGFLITSGKAVMVQVAVAA